MYICHVPLVSCRITCNLHSAFCTKAVYVIFFWDPVELCILYLLYFVQRQYMSYSSGFLSNCVHCTYRILYKGSICHILLSSCRIMYSVHAVFFKMAVYTYISYSKFLSNYVHSTYCILSRSSICHILLGSCRITYTVLTVL